MYLETVQLRVKVVSLLFTVQALGCSAYLGCKVWGLRGSGCKALGLRVSGFGLQDVRATQPLNLSLALLAAGDCTPGCQSAPKVYTSGPTAFPYKDFWAQVYTVKLHGPFGAGFLGRLGKYKPQN